MSDLTPNEKATEVRALLIRAANTAKMLIADIELAIVSDKKTPFAFRLYQSLIDDAERRLAGVLNGARAMQRRLTDAEIETLAGFGVFCAAAAV